MGIPARYQPEPLSPLLKQGWLEWSLDFFGDPGVRQDPYVDICLQLSLTQADRCYRERPQPGASLFAFLTWHLVQAMRAHPSFNLRRDSGQWYLCRNLPVVIPVAVGGHERFREILIEDPARLDYPEFITRYRRLLDQARSDQGGRCDLDSFSLAHFFGNLPNLRFTGLSLHWRQTPIIGQTGFYFGQRYQQDGHLLIPLAVKLHHACTDPWVLNGLLEDFQARFE